MNKLTCLLGVTLTFLYNIPTLPYPALPFTTTTKMNAK